jgi:hypothetical protein
MTDDELRRAIERPTQLVGWELEAGLVDLLVQDVRHHPGALPLLQHALLELWNKREGRRLIVKAYQEIGKLEGALQRRADATLKAFSQDGVPLSLEPHSQVINDRFLINKTLSKPECQLHQRQT